MDTTSNDMVMSCVKVDFPHHRRFTEINKYGDSPVPHYMDINVRIDEAYGQYTPGMRWIIRLAQRDTLARLQLDNPPHIYLCEVCEGEGVYTAVPQFVDQLFGTRLTIIVLIRNSEDDQRELLIWPEPIL